jgi:hypothetical protein
MSADVNSPRDCSNIGFVGVRPWEEGDVVLRRNFVIRQLRPNAEHIERLSATV